MMVLRLLLGAASPTIEKGRGECSCSRLALARDSRPLAQNTRTFVDGGTCTLDCGALVRCVCRVGSLQDRDSPCPGASCHIRCAMAALSADTLCDLAGWQGAVADGDRCHKRKQRGKRIPRAALDLCKQYGARGAALQFRELPGRAGVPSHGLRGISAQCAGNTVRHSARLGDVAAVADED